MNVTEHFGSAGRQLDESVCLGDGPTAAVLSRSCTLSCCLERRLEAVPTTLQNIAPEFLIDSFQSHAPVAT